MLSFFDFINRIVDSILDLLRIDQVSAKDYEKPLRWPGAVTEDITIYKEQGDKVIRRQITKYNKRVVSSNEDAIERNHPDYVKLKSTIDELSNDLNQLNDELFDCSSNKDTKDK